MKDNEELKLTKNPFWWFGKNPSSYRLAKKSNGELVLQGAYAWDDGLAWGYVWRDIPTVDYEEGK